MPNISTGATGCPVDQLAVFNYSRGNRTWNAACGEQHFLCSARGGIRCTKQQDETVNREVAIRAKALLQVPAPQREWFVNKDIARGSWSSFALVVATVKAMSVQQLEKLDPRRVFALGSAAFDQAVKRCVGDGFAIVRVEASGALTSATLCNAEVLESPELAPLKQRPFKNFFLVSGVFGLKPVARPTVGGATTEGAPELGAKAAPQDAEAEPASPAATELPASAELDAGVRRWLDAEAPAILACTGKEQSALQVRVDAEAKVEVTIRGAAAGSPEEGCVRSTLSKVPPLPPGPATILHLVRKQQ